MVGLVPIASARFNSKASALSMACFASWARAATFSEPIREFFRRGLFPGQAFLRGSPLSSRRPNAPRRTSLQPNFVRNRSRRGQSSRPARHARMGRALLRRDAQRERRPGKNRQAGRLCAIDPDRRSPRPQITRRARWIKRAGCQSGRPALGRGSIRFSRAPFCRVELGLAEPWVLR